MALIAPYFIDWTAYKRNFEDEATKIFGQPVSVGGDAQIRLLPLPSVSFGNLSVGQNEDGSPLMSIEQFSANVELVPFLSGEVKVVDMNLYNPTLNLEISENGTIAWTNPQALKIDPAQVELNQVSVSGGRIDLRGLSDNRQVSIRDINADLNAKSLVGPWRIGGAAQLNEDSILFNISTGRLQETGSMRVKLDIRNVDQPYQLILDGSVGLDEDLLVWNGDFNIDPVRDTDKDALTYSSKSALPVKVDGKFLLSPNRLEVVEFRSDIGEGDDPFVVTGRGSVNLLEDIFFRFQVDGRQIDIDRIAGMRGQNATSNINERLEIARSVIEHIPVPNFDGEIDFEIPAIVAGDTVVREISALVSPITNGWDVRRLVAKLPGSSTLETNGRLGLGDDFGYDGHLLIASRQPSGFASWAIGHVDPVVRQLTSGGIEADVTFTSNQTSFENMNLVLDDRKLTGRLQRIGAKTNNGAAGKDAVLISINADELNLADLKAVLTMTGAAGADDFGNVDLDAVITANRFKGFDVEADGVDLQFRFTNGELAISKLNIDSFYGAKTKSSGQIVDLLKKPKGNFKFQLAAENGGRLLTLLQERYGVNHLVAPLLRSTNLSENLNLNIEIDARPNEINSTGRMLVTGEIGGTSIESQVGFQADFSNLEEANFDISTKLNNQDPEIVLSQLGIIELKQIDQLIGESLVGPLNLNVDAVGGIGAGFSTIISAATPDISLSSKGLLNVVQSQTDENQFQLNKYEMEVTAAAQNAGPLLSKFNSSLPDFFSDSNEDISISLKSDVRFENGVTQFNELRSQLNGKLIQGQLSYQQGDSGRPTLSGTLDAEEIELANLINSEFGVTDARLNQQVPGWSDVEFGSALFEGYDAQIELGANIVNAGFGLKFNDAKTSVVVRNGEMEFSKYIFGFLGGQVRGDLSVKNKNRNGLLQGQFFAEKIDANLLLGAFGGPSVLSGRINANGTFDSSGKSAKALINALSGSGIISIENATLNGVSADKLALVLEESDVEGFEINEAAINQLIEKHFLTGTMSIAEENSAYSISKGKAQIRNLVHAGDGFELGFNGAVSLEDGLSEVGLRMSIDPLINKVAGGTSEFDLAFKGPFSKPELEIQSQALQGFLSIRAFEFEQRRVELLQAQILEKQRLRREVVRINTRRGFKEQVRLERLRQEEEARLEALRLAEEQRRAEAKRIEDERRAEEARLEQERQLAEAARREEEARLAREAEIAEAEKRLQEERAAEQLRIQKQLEEEARLEREQKAAKELQQKSGFEVNQLPALVPIEPVEPGVLKSIDQLLFPNQNGG